jgi:hypothetical protein
MKIAFFTEMGFSGKIPRGHTNMRTEFAWMCALNADHHNILSNPNEKYDLGIIITPKNNPQNVNLQHIKQFCDKVGVMQEGPFWYFQDYTLENQIHYFNNLLLADIIYVHNEQDKRYYQGLTNHNDVRVLRSLMITDNVKQYEGERTGVMIGGNFVSWYGGFDSFMIASSITDEIYSPKMGRAIEGEEQLGIKQLPYLQWTDWMYELSKRKIGVHLMRTHAAGTFAMNCSYLGIPCIGYEELDTQYILHPLLTVENGDLEMAKKLITLLETDKDFYQECSTMTKDIFNKEYNENKFYTTFQKQFKVS